MLKGARVLLVAYDEISNGEGQYGDHVQSGRTCSQTWSFAERRVCVVVLEKSVCALFYATHSDEYNWTRFNLNVPIHNSSDIYVF